MQCGSCSSPLLQACQNGLLVSVGVGRIAIRSSTSAPFHQHGAADRENPAIAADQRDARIFDLPAPSLAAQLTHGFNEVEYAADVTLRHQATMGVDGAAPAERTGAAAHERAGFAVFRDAECI